MYSLEDLGVSNIKIYQKDGLYKFTSDSILLAKFSKVKKGDVVADFCSGSGIVGFYLYGLNPDKVKSITFFELQTPLYEMSKDSIELNGLTDKFFANNLKIQDIDSSYAGKFSLITCNPPYMEKDSGFTDKDQSIAICKSEIYLPLQDLVKAISKCLKFGGRVNMVNRADRLADVFSEFKKNNIEPKKLQFVSAKGKKPYLFMVEGVKGGKSGLNVLENAQN